MAKYILFNEQATTADIGAAAHDVALYPIDRFIGMTNEGTTETEVTMFFRGIEGDENDAAAAKTSDKVVLTITVNKYVSVMKEIVQAMNAGPHDDGVLVLFDAETGKSVSSDVTGCAITVGTGD
jgi:uncharacterized membrane protein required for colicin V production